jgi:hypothetical protein
VQCGRPQAQDVPAPGGAGSEPFFSGPTTRVERLSRLLMRINRTSKSFKIASVSVVVAIFGVIAKIFIDNWHKVPFDRIHFHYGYLAAGLGIIIPGSILPVLLWRYILSLLNEHPSMLHLWRVATYSQVARYLPGRIWQYMGRVYWGKKMGISETNILLSSLLEMIFFLSSAFFVSFFSLNLFVSVAYQYALAAITLAMLIFLHPRVLEKAVNLLAKRLLPKPVTLTFSYGRILFIIVWYIVIWGLAGLQYFFFLNSFYYLPSSKIVVLTSINAASWLVGAVSMISPGGIGIKEGVFVFIFKSVIPVSIAIILALFLRFASIAWDLLVAAIFFIFDKGAWRNFLDFRKHPPEGHEETGALPIVR